jgi:CMP/dCMP kinase
MLSENPYSQKQQQIFCFPVLALKGKPSPMNPIVIAIDGPAGSGKGTLARSLAQHLCYAYLDTGALYRYVGLEMLNAGQDAGHEGLATSMAQKLASTLHPDALQNPALRSDEAGQAASKVAQFSGVRDALLKFQKDFAQNPNQFLAGQSCTGVILDGRDIGTVICPQADVKFFVTASVEERAKRRLFDLNSRGIVAAYETVLEDMKARDLRDQQRATAPLKPASDSIIMDTTTLSPDAVLAQALTLIAKTLGTNR